MRRRGKRIRHLEGGRASGEEFGGECDEGLLVGSLSALAQQRHVQAVLSARAAASWLRVEGKGGIESTSQLLHRRYLNCESSV